MAQISFSGYTRTHLSLNKDCPETRAIQGSAARNVIARWPIQPPPPRPFVSPSNACVLSHYRHFSCVASQAIRKKTVAIMRTIALSLTLLALPVVPAGADSPAAATKIHWVFDIVRRGDKIGTDTIDIERQNDTTTIKIKKDVSVKVMLSPSKGLTSGRSCSAASRVFFESQLQMQ